jgi:hypothetical protein
MPLPGLSPDTSSGPDINLFVLQEGRAQEDKRELRLQTVLDPCVGTGRMLLHASNFSYCLYGCDIDPLVAMITRINGALYAPWLTFPFSESIGLRTCCPQSFGTVQSERRRLLNCVRQSRPKYQTTCSTRKAGPPRCRPSRRQLLSPVFGDASRSYSTFVPAT